MRDLWMCGSSVHPGGGIMGAPGRIAALEVPAARRARAAGPPSAWRPPETAAARGTRSSSGGGHNGLVCAAYLARAGLRTLVLERRDAVGGALATSELVPGARVPDLAHTVGRLRGSIARDLGLAAHGLRLVQPAARVTSVRPDGPAITLWGDPPAHGRGLAAISAPDADAGSPSMRRSGRSRVSCRGSRRSRRPTRRRPRPATCSAPLRLGLHLRGMPERRRGRC